MVFIRRLSSAVLIVGLMAVAVIFCRGPMAGLIVAIGVILALSGVLEYYRMLETKGLTQYKFYGGAVTVVYMVAIFLDSYFDRHGNCMEGLTIFIIVVGLFVLQAFERTPRRALGNISGVLSGFLYVPWLLAYFVKILYFPGVDGRWYIFALLFIVKGGDMLAYAVGSSFGRHKLIPRISPNKTWEGAAGGLAGSLIAGLVIWKWFPCGFTLPSALIMAALLSVLGQVGDLAESMLKRDAGLKDSSGFIPGIGGALDVLDSLLLTLPVLYFYLLFYR